MKNKENILKNLVNENKQLRDKNNQNNELIEQLKYELDISKSNSNNNDLENENKILKEKLLNFDNVINQVNKYKLQIKQLEKDKKDILDNFQTKIDSIQSLTTDSEKLSDEIKRKDEDIILLEQKNEELLKQLSIQTQKIELKDKEINNKLYKYREEIDRKNTEVNELKEKMLNNEKLLITIENYKDQIKKLQDKYNSQITESNENFDQLRSNQTSLTSQLQIIEEKDQNIRDLKFQIDRLKEAIVNKTNKINELEKKINNKDSDDDDDKDKNCFFERILQLEDDLKNKEIIIDELTNSNKEKDQRIMKLEQVKMTKDIVNKIRQLYDKSKQLKTENSNLKQQLDITTKSLQTSVLQQPPPSQDTTKDIPPIPSCTKRKKTVYFNINRMI